MSVPAALWLVQTGLHGIVTTAPPGAWLDKERPAVRERESRVNRPRLQISFEFDHASLGVRRHEVGERVMNERIVVRNLSSETISKVAIEVRAIGAGMPPQLLPRMERRDLRPSAEMKFPVVVDPNVALAWGVQVTGETRWGEPIVQNEALWVL
jgi:hypothetical protein